jgi:precorrin-3B synthase
MTPLRRGVCPTLRAPLLSGDGYLARWMPHEPLPLDTFGSLCDLSERLGNGVLEVTHRGSIQIRGLRSESELVSEVRRLGAGVQEQPPLLTPPLLEESSPGSKRARQVCRDIVALLAEWPRTHELNPKVSITLDYDTPLHLDHLRSDIRLFCGPETAHLALGGDASNATAIGWLTFAGVLQALERVLTLLVERGSDSRARDLVSGATFQTLRTSLAHRLVTGEVPPSRGHPVPVQTYALSDGTIARGFGLAFGFASADQLRSFARTAARLGARAIRPYADRTLVLLGLPPEADRPLVAAAEKLGLVTSPDDPRRYVIACAGAPVCASAHLPTRSLAPRIALAAKNLLSPASPIHLSGCPKGCAHAGPAPLTFTGPDALIIDGSAAGQPTRRVSAESLISELQRLSACREPGAESAAVGNPYDSLRATAFTPVSTAGS